MRKRTGCKLCNNNLPDERKGVGFCDTCAGIEIKRIKKRFRSSAIGGAIFFLVIFAAITFVKVNYANYANNDVDYVVFSATFFGSVNGLLRGIAGISLTAQLVIYLVCFVIPFGKYIKLDMDGPGVVGLSVILIELLISAASGPFIILYDTYKLIRLSGFSGEETTR